MTAYRGHENARTGDGPGRAQDELGNVRGDGGDYNPLPEPDTEIRYSRGASKFDAFPVQWEADDFGAFEQFVLDDRARAKGKQYITNPMERDADGKPHRCNANALPRRWVPFDFDGFRDPEAYLETIAYLHRYRGFLYATASSTATAPRARAILEATRPMDAGEGKAACLALEARIVAELGEGAIKFDQSVYGPSQPLYCPPFGSETYRFEGHPADVDALLKEVPETKTGTAARHEATPTEFPTEAQVAELRSALLALDPDPRPPWVDVAHDLYPSGAVGFELWDEWSRRSARYDEADALRVWESCRDSHSGFRAVFSKALAIGWRAARPETAEADGPPPPEDGDAGPWAGTEEPPDHGTRPLRRTLGAVPAKVPDPATLIATEGELEDADLHPRCIVKDHTYADVAQIVAPGGTGKTTMLIFEAVHIAIGRPLWGLEVLSPGWTLFVTAEDQRPHLMARLREILRTMDLTAEERAVAIAGFRVWDVAGESVKLINARDGNIVLTSLADDIVAACQADPPAVVVFDPTVSFGASEQAVNDNEQGIVTAARRIVKGLDCCVRLVHHTGKANGREKTLDQYSGRGGSALADGSRMTSVLQAWTPDDGGTLRPPAGCTADQKSSITILARAKLSYAKPNLPLIWIRRTGFAFEHFVELPVSREEARASKSDQVERFLASELAAGRYHTQRGLDDYALDLNMARSDLRRALSDLRASRRVYDAPLPEHLLKGARKTYLHPSNCAITGGAIPPPEAPNRATEAGQSITAPPYREKKDGAIPPAFLPPDPVNCAASNGAIRRSWRNSPSEAPEALPQDVPETPQNDDAEDVV